MPGKSVGIDTDREKEPDGRRVSKTAFNILSQKTADETADLYTQVFLNDEPMTKRHGIDPAQFLPYARKYLYFCANQNLSLISVECETQEVTGFILCSDFSTDWNSFGHDMISFLSFFQESMAILEEVEHRCPELDAVLPGKALHVFQLGVRRDYRGQGIARELLAHVLDMAGQRGFSTVFAECTGPISRHIFERCGFRCRGYVRYDEFITQGQIFFQGLPGGISLMIRDV